MNTTNVPVFGGLEFEFAELVREIRDFKEIAKRFLDPSASDSLDLLRSALENIQAAAPLEYSPSARPDYPWEIPHYSPVVTKPSRAYERGERASGPEVYARLTSIWQVIPMPKLKKGTPPKTFRVVGKASVRVEWREAGDTDRSLGVWRMEMADGSSPGCYFHAQIMGEDGWDSPPFPHAVCVPRLPCIAFTPMAVLEFVLGELFQDEWENHTRILTPNVENWRAIQRRRLGNLYAWQQEVVGSSDAPPWTLLKRAKPDAQRFLSHQ